MTHRSAPDLLALHAVRITGFADTPAIAARYALDQAAARAELREAEARGWVAYSEFAGAGGWSLTAEGRAENERGLAAELVHADAAEEVREVYRRFLPLNGMLRQACTDWQLRPSGGDRLAVNDHGDAAWDEGVLHELAVVHRALEPLAARLSGVLARFGGYGERFGAALARVRAGDGGWVDRTDVDSCHRVWFELHEDLVATLGVDRGAEVH